MLKLDDAERYMLTQDRALSTDEHGNEIFVGLTVEETEALLQDRRQFRDAVLGKGERNRDNRKYFAMLREKHERARFAVIGAEHQARIDKPTFQ